MHIQKRFVDPGLGTLSFFGKSLFLENITFSNNYNSRAGAIYVDGRSDVLDLNVTFNNLIFSKNFVLNNGGAMYFGSGILNLNGIFQNMTCDENKAEYS